MDEFPEAAGWPAASRAARSTCRPDAVVLEMARLRLLEIRGG